MAEEKFCPFRVEANLTRVSDVSEYNSSLRCVREKCQAWCADFIGERCERMGRVDKNRG